jgi:uncharacterized membrane protein
MKTIYSILKIILKILGLKKIKNKDDLTTLIGAIIGIICIILNQYFGIEIPEDMTLAIIGVIVAIIFRFWKPEENK